MIMLGNHYILGVCPNFSPQILEPVQQLGHGRSFRFRQCIRIVDYLQVCIGAEGKAKPFFRKVRVGAFPSGLENDFTDSKAYPLEGGVAYFELRHQDPERSISRTLVSDASGKAQELLQFGTCEGGRAAEYFVHRHNGRNTWATRYKVGKYFAANVLL
jgi:hypothetical protein